MEMRREKREERRERNTLPLSSLFSPLSSFSP
jgi:hypothetical protein